MKLVKTNNKDIVNNRRIQFQIYVPSTLSEHETKN